MILTRTTLQAVAFLLAASAAPAQESIQKPTSPAIPPPAASPAAVHHPRPRPKPEAASPNFDLVVLDPGHGGSDPGARLPGGLVEKDVTLALANTLRSLLTTRGFTVVLTRENSADEVSADARVELANRSRPLACLLLHATGAGHGVHLFTSALTPPAAAQSQFEAGLILPWDTAQAVAVAQSLSLAGDLASALNGIRAPLATGRVSVSPIDSLTCPAAAIEIAPVAGSAGTESEVSDPSYQQHVAEALAAALVFWRGHAQTAAAAAAAAIRVASPPQTAPAAKPKPRPKSAAPDGLSPNLTPELPPTRKPAPIIRRPAPVQSPEPSGGQTR